MPRFSKWHGWAVDIEEDRKMPIHSKGIMVEGNIDEVYDLALAYFSSTGFTLKTSNKPTQLFFERGSLWTSEGRVFKKEDLSIFSTKKCKLKVNLSGVQNRILVRCDYDIHWLDDSGRGDTDNINTELEGLKNLLSQSGEKIIITSIPPIYSEDIHRPVYHPGIGSLIFGIIMLVLGIAVYSYTQPAIVHYESLLGTISRGIGSAVGYTELELKYQMLKLLNIGSFIAMIIGVISVIIGLIGKRE